MNSTQTWANPSPQTYLPSVNIMNMCTVQGPIPFTAVKRLYS